MLMEWILETMVVGVRGTFCVANFRFVGVRVRGESRLRCG
jgi:hypothetical protein